MNILVKVLIRSLFLECLDSFSSRAWRAIRYTWCEWWFLGAHKCKNAAVLKSKIVWLPTRNHVPAVRAKSTKQHVLDTVINQMKCSNECVMLDLNQGSRKENCSILNNKQTSCIKHTHNSKYHIFPIFSVRWTLYKWTVVRVPGVSTQYRYTIVANYADRDLASSFIL